MADRTPWIVVVTGETTSNVSRTKCLRCGDAHDITLPMNVTEWVKRNRQFEKRHAKCEAPRG